MGIVSTGYQGNLYYIVGSVASVAQELNSKNAKPQNVINLGFDGTAKNANVCIGRP